MNYKVKIAITLISILLLGLVIGIYQYSRKVPGLESKQADFTMTADQLYNEFEGDEASANKKYLDKIIAVKGEVISVKTDIETSTVTLKAENSMMGGINCSFKGPVKEVQEGSFITIKGRCQGFLMDVVLNNCVIK